MHNVKFVALLLAVLSAFVAVSAKNPLNYYANKAEESLSAGRYEDALDYARQEIIDYEGNPNGYYQAAISLYTLQQPGQALSMLNKALERAKKDKPLAAQCCLAKADLLKEMGDTIQAINALNDGIKLDGKNVDLLVERASTLIGSDNKTALKDLQKIKKLASSDPRGYIYMAYLLVDEKNYKDALDEVTRAIALDNSMDYSYGLRGLILQKLGYSPDWIRDCLKSYDLDNESSLGIILLASEEDANVREQIINEIETKRTSLNGYYKLEADLLYTWKLFSLAGKAYEEMINLGLADATTYYYLGDCQKRLGFVIDAYATASQGLDKFPNDLALKYMKAQIGVLAGKGDEVLGILNSLIAESPEADALYAEKGRAYMSLGRYSEAVEPFNTAVILNPSALNKMYYGDALRLSGNTIKANSEYNDILRMSENTITDEGQVPQYMYAMAYSGLGQRNDALAAIKTLSKDYPSAEISYLPCIYSRLGSKSESIAALKTYTKENKWNALFDLYTYNFHPLHSEQAFIDLLAENDVKTRYNQTTNLLEYAPDGLNISSGGTSIEEAMAVIADNPKDWVRAYNQLCPIDMGVGGQIVSVEYNEATQTITETCVTNPILFNFKLVNSNLTYKQKKEDVIALGLITQNPEIANLGVTFKYIFKASDGSEQTAFTLTSNKMKTLLRKSKSQEEVDKMMLDFWCEEETLMFPENPMTPDATISLSGNTLTYTYPTSESDGSFSRIELFKSELRNQLASFFNDPSMRNRIPVYVRQNITLRFTYKGKETGKTVDIEFAPTELATYLK